MTVDIDVKRLVRAEQALVMEEYVDISPIPLVNSENSGQSRRSALECKLETQSVFIWNTVLIWLKLVSPFGIGVCFLLSYLTIYHFVLRFYWLGGRACRGTGIILGTFCWLLFTQALSVFDLSDMVNRQSFEKTVTYLIKCFDWRSQEPVKEQNHLSEFITCIVI